MTFYPVLLLLLGLVLFLYGMKVMSSSLEYAAEERLRLFLKKLTANRFMGVLAGAGITAIIQSSSATTVMVVGLVNSGILSLEQAVGVIMGANIGTTVTGQLLAVNLDSAAPYFVFLGLFFMLLGEKSRWYQIGRLFFGLGALFLGMKGMETAMAPLGKSVRVLFLLSKLKSPVAGILAGAVFTALIQSSSASVGILQSLLNSGALGLKQSVFILFGQNIGTCITAVLASVGGSDYAKRATIVHILFNVLGTCLFTLICLFTPFTEWMARFTPKNPAAQIANIHTVFNLVTAALLLPFGRQLMEVSEMLWKGGNKKKETAGLQNRRI